MILFTLPCGRVVVNICNRKTPPKNQKLIFMVGHIVMFPPRSSRKRNVTNLLIYIFVWSITNFHSSVNFLSGQKRKNNYLIMWQSMSQEVRFDIIHVKITSTGIIPESLQLEAGYEQCLCSVFCVCVLRSASC